MEKIGNKEDVCAYDSSSFHGAEQNYLSIHKKILAIKKAVKHFKMYLNPIKFIIRTNFKIIPSIFKNENLMAENNSGILKWFVLLQKFYFDIVYKPGYLNFLVDMLTMEFQEVFQDSPSLGMFLINGASSINPLPNNHKKEWKLIDENDVEHATRQLQYSNLMKPEDHKRYQKVVN